MIEIKNISKKYGKTVVLEDISLTIPKGGISTIIGPNGAGKSTLLGIISRLLKADSGTVSVDGMDVQRCSSNDLAKRLAVLRQNSHISARLTVEDLVAFGRYPYSKGRPTREDAEYIDAALEYLELQPFRARFLDELSGGQRQRAFVAAVLCQDTDYLLLDEPLNSLDIRYKVSMMQRLSNIARDFDKTVLLVLHDINCASCYSDAIIAMKAGRLLYHDTVASIMQPEVLRHIYDIDVSIHDVNGQSICTYYS